MSGKNTTTPAKQDGFKSQWGFIMAAVGSCVGMANVWRFPMLVSRYGGLTFLIPYFIFAIVISQSGMMEEFSLGRWAGYGPVGSFGKAMENGGKSKKAGELIGGVPVFASLCLGIGYSVIMGWVFYYAKMALTGELVAMGNDMNVIGGTFGAVAPEAASLPEAIKMTFTTGGANKIWIILAIAVSFLIMILGIAGGIEKSCKVMIPALYVLFIILAIMMPFVPGSSEGYKYIFTLKPEGLLNPQVWVFAFGQAFFSLSVAGNGSVIYGSYLPKDEDLPSSARNVALFDTIAALLAAIVIIPAMAVILGDGIVGMKGGPGLMFVYLVNVFNAMPGGRIVGMIFYICVLFAGVSSIVNLYEAPVAFLQEKLHTNRVLSVVIIGAVGGVIALCIQPWTSQWMDVVSIYICPLGALLAGIMFFWVMKKDTALAAVHEGRTVGKKDISGWFYPLGKWVYCAASLAALILGAIYGGIG